MTTMKRIVLCYSIILLSSVFLFFSCSSFKDKSWEEDYIVNDDYKEFSNKVDDYLTESNFNGCVLVGQNKKIIFAKGYGLCDVKDKYSQEITIHTVFETGSLSKLATACCVMQLAQKNKISVKDNLLDYFPTYKKSPDITIDLLLRMRSGLTDCINSSDEFFSSKIYKEVLKKQYANQPLKENLVLENFYTAPLLTNPDSTYFYCNTNYYLLAKIVEEVSGTPFNNYLKQNVFDVAGMKNTNTDFQRTDSKGYDYLGRYYSIPSELAFGCGSVNSTVLDLFKFNTAFAEGKIVKKKTVKKMTDFDSYGYGIYCKENEIFHSGATNVFNSYNSYDFKKKLSVIVLINEPVSKTNATIVAGNIKKYWE